MRGAIIAVGVVGVGVLCGGLAGAEEGSAYPTAVSVVGGVSVGTSQTVGRQLFGLGDAGEGSGFAVGGGFAHDLSPRLTLEVNGLYLDRSSSAWSADAGLRINLVPTSRSLVPYFAVSGGVYSERMQTNFGALVDGVEKIDPVIEGLARLLPQVRSIYGFVEDAGRSLPFDTHTTHTSGLLTLGGGVTFASGEHVFVRPDARAQVLFGDDTHVLGLFTLNFGYRF
jgi:hypothetical protein